MKRFVRILLLICIVAFCEATVYPCSCEVWKPEKKLRKARAVFVGEVVAIGSNAKDRFATVSIKFKVDRYWKGIKEPYITVVSAPGICCTCGLAVSVGLKFLVYAFKTENDQIETSLCMSAPLDAERSQDELRVLGKGKTLKARPAPNAVEQIVGPVPPQRASHQSDPVLSWRVLAGGGPVNSAVIRLRQTDWTWETKCR